MECRQAGLRHVLHGDGGGTQHTVRRGQKDFGTYYRAINAEDESTFTATLTPTEGSLGLYVNFYERSLFPRAACHSEGHQDGVGVCLSIALMKRLFGTQFTFAIQRRTGF